MFHWILLQIAVVFLFITFIFLLWSTVFRLIAQWNCYCSFFPFAVLLKSIRRMRLTFILQNQLGFNFQNDLIPCDYKVRYNNTIIALEMDIAPNSLFALWFLCALHPNWSFRAVSPLCASEHAHRTHQIYITHKNKLQWLENQSTKVCFVDLKHSEKCQ